MDLQLQLQRLGNRVRRMKAAALAFMISRASLTLAEQSCLVEDLDRVPRNRAERRRFAASGVARRGGGIDSPLLSLHRRIKRDQQRQAQRRAAGRHVWA
ncbi:hypothetical protein VQH23_20995 [Pararoseomonas sp. SCSIO 73927]|uniref:hypothetical protein n=1 Tax=Pararoseomonas sp. SCSIO 73927 TaxID=3114537 RepID=UPI0030D44BED